MTNGHFLTGGGSMERQGWQPLDDQRRTYTVSSSILRFAWTEFALSFTPASNGVVTLDLRGPWEQSPNAGPIFQQEVLWDGLSVTNATLTNGSFESVNALSVPAGWVRPYGGAVSMAATTGIPAFDGQRYLRAWHDSPLTTTMSVRAGVPVIIHAAARAFVPAGWPEMARVSDTNTAAHRAIANFRRGANYGNYLEAPLGQNWGQTYGLADLVQTKAEGFDHVRLPVGWHSHTGPAPDFTISNTIFGNVDALVTNALQTGLNIIVNIHNFDDFTTDPVGQTTRFLSIWRQIATHYSNFPSGLAFEFINEPKDNATTTVINPIYAEAIRQVRLTNPARTLFVGPGQFNSIRELPALLLPDDDLNLITTVHSYAPFYFTHQGATWAGEDVKPLRNIRFPGPPATPLSPPGGMKSYLTNWIASYNTLPPDQNPCGPAAFRDDLMFLKNWSDYYGRPVHMGEFGAYESADAASRANFYRAMREHLDRLNIAWAIWDWKAGFKYWNPAARQPVPGMRDALFPKPILRSGTPGVLDLDGTPGRFYRLDRALDLTPPVDWAPFATQAMGAYSNARMLDWETNRPSLFYRAEVLPGTP